MADRSFLEKDVFSNAPHPVCIFLKFTGAADVNANGYTINHGGGFVSTVAKAAEGKITITLADTYPLFLGIDVDISKDDTDVVVDAETVATNKTITLTTRTGGADTDADSTVFYCRIWLQNTSDGVQ